MVHISICDLPGESDSLCINYNLTTLKNLWKKCYCIIHTWMSVSVAGLIQSISSLGSKCSVTKCRDTNQHQEGPHQPKALLLQHRHLAQFEQLRPVWYPLLSSFSQLSSAPAERLCPVFANKMLLMNLLLHWLWSGVDIRHQISRLWFTSLCSSFPSQINPSLLWSQSLKERRESQRVEKIDIFLVQHVPCKQTTFFLSNKCNNNSQNK